MVKKPAGGGEGGGAPRTRAPSSLGDPVRVAAWLYYAENRTQNEVAQELGVSRQTVANYIAEARENGLVAIRLAPDLLAENELARRLCERYGLEKAFVAPTTESETPPRERVARLGAHVLLALTADGDTIGVSSGRTISALARALPKARRRQSRVVQVSGSSIRSQSHSPEVCASDIAARLSAECWNLHAPDYLSSAELTDSLQREPALTRHFAAIAETKILAFGVGELSSATLFEHSPFLNEAARDAYLHAGAQAVVFGRFLTRTGEEAPGPLRDRTIAISLAQARSIGARLAVCGEAAKRDAVRAAMAGGLITHLVLDEALARALLQEE